MNTKLSLLASLESYIHDGDETLTREQFLRNVADRIDDDLMFHRAGFPIFAPEHLGSREA